MKNIYVLITINIVIFYSSLNAQWVRTNLPYNVTSLAAESNISGGTNLFAGTSNHYLDPGSRRVSLHR